MPKSPRSKAPGGLYTASEAIKRLNMPPATFHHYVRSGKIKKIVPPGRSEGYYEKAYIDKMAKASQMFALQYAEDSSTFSAASEEDIQGIYDVNVSLWGALNATSIEVRRSWYKSNPKIDYVVKKEGIVAGYISIMPLKPEVISQLMAGKIRGWDIKAEDVLPFTPGTPLECYTGVAVRSGVYKSEMYGVRLLLGIIDVLEEMGREGIIIKRLYAVSDTPDGVSLSRRLGFDEKLPAEGSTFKQYVLDIETSNSHFAEEYKQVLKSYQAKNK